MLTWGGVSDEGERVKMSSLHVRKLMAATVALGTLLTLPLVPSAAADMTINVTTTADGNWDSANFPNSCTAAAGSPAAGQCSLRAAVQYADGLQNAGDGNLTIDVPAGTYKFTVPNSVGPRQPPPNRQPHFDGGSTYFLDVTYTAGSLDIVGAGAASTIVDANLLDRAFIIESGAVVTMSGLTIEDGRPGNANNVAGCPSSFTAASGGGMLDDGTLTLTKDVLTNNIAPGDGGGVEDAATPGDAGVGVLTITGSTLSNNYACGNGGSSPYGNGGGVDESGGANVTIDTSTFSGNQAASDGGGVDEAANGNATTNGTVTITDSSLIKNVAYNGGGVGGEGCAQGCDATRGVLDLYRDLFAHNYASTVEGSGGAVWAAAGSNNGGDPITLVNSTVTGNIASEGGGVFNSFNGTISFSTINANTASSGGSSGGNIYTANEGPGWTVDDSIVTAGMPDNCGGGGVNSGGYNLFDDNETGFGGCNAVSTDLTYKNPVLGPLADNGGPTQTEALLAGSPAVDAASMTACTAETPNSSSTLVDQRDGVVPRPQPTGGECDIGAFEATPDDNLDTTVANNPVIVGQTDTVTDTITNSGPQPAPNTTFTDPAAGFTIDSATASQGTCTHTPTTVSCALGTLAPGQSVTVTIVVTGTSPGVLTLTGAVAQGAFDPTSGNNSDTVAITVVAPPKGPLADLAIAVKASPKTMAPGADVTYTLTASNLGPNNDTGVTVSDSLPKGFTLGSAHPSTGRCHGSQVVICDLGSLAVGARDTITVHAITAGTGKIVDAGTITGNLGDPNLKNNIAHAAIELVGGPTASLGALGPACHRENSTIGLTATATARSGLRTITIMLGGAVLKRFRYSGRPTHKTVTVPLRGSTLLSGRSYRVTVRVSDTGNRSAHDSGSFTMCLPKVSRGFTG
jgi:uncharacterized repeat protein (TIGR01451 family)